LGCPLILVVDLKRIRSRAFGAEPNSAPERDQLALVAVDVEDVTRDDLASSETEEHDCRRGLIGEDASTERNLGTQGPLVLAVQGKARAHAGLSVGAVARQRSPEFLTGRVRAPPTW